jgi:hypothetical protein
MPLVIETGEGLENSNSYVSLEEFAEYAADRLQDLPADEPAQQALLLRAMEYLESIDDYKGVRNTGTQALKWPRTGVYIDGFPVAKNKIPTNLKRAQMQLGIEAISYDLMPSTDGFAVASEKVDVIEVEYATGGRLSGSTAPAVPEFPKVDALLKDLRTNTGMKLRGVRI